MKPGDALQALLDAMGVDAEKADGYGFDRTSVCLTPEALADVLDWAREHTGGARMLAMEVGRG